LNYPDNNPKTLAGASRLPLHLVPPSAVAALASAMADGARKYGPYNWRTSPISVSTYVSAAQRHLHAYWDGEDNARDSGVHHLAHAMASMALLIDALSLDVLVDDRPPKGKAADLQAAYANKNKEVPKSASTRIEEIPSRDSRFRTFHYTYDGYSVESCGVPDHEADVRKEGGPE
jgi:hypothetical protein